MPTAQGEPVVGPSLEGGGVNGGFSPADLRSAYKLPSTGGLGQTVAITIAFDDPKAESDLATYRSHYGLPACTTANGCFSKVNRKGEEENYPAANSNWALETSLDLDMISATCPECHILLVEADSAYLEDLDPAVQKAAELGAAVISNSWAAEEFSGESAEDHYFEHPGIPTLFATGDWGYGVYYPAASPDVIAVGGTRLKKAATYRGWSETAWSEAGSGCSKYESKPAWQKDAGCAGRTVADVSAVADPVTPVSVYDSFESSGWALVGGTSVATPLMAGVEALSSSEFRAAGPSAFTRIGQGGGLFDVTEGENGPCAAESETAFEATYLCQADIGYDGPTGWGTPDGPQSLPVAVTESATIESTEKATLRGSVNPKGLPTEYRFEYGETTAYGTSVPIPDETVGAGSEYVEVEQKIEGLKGQTPYHYRIVASHSEETFPGVDRTFGTTPPTVNTGAADEIHASSATLHATVDPEGLDSTYYFEYGLTTSYGHKAPVKAGALAASTESVEVSAGVSGLDGATTYYYRAVARNAAGVVRGAPSSFTTEPPEWTVEYMPQPPNSGEGYRPYGVSCAQANECVTVGENWSLAVHTKVTLAERWDGSSWSAMTTPNPPGLNEGWKHEWYALLRGVSCTPNDDCIAVGRYRDPTEVGKPLAEHWSGSEWTIMPVAEPPGATDARLASVSCASAANCVAVGSSKGGSGVESTLVEHWDGSEWAIKSTPIPGTATASRLLGVSCSSSTACVAVGSYDTSAGAEKTLAVHLSEGAWAIRETPNPGTRSEARLDQVSCSSPSLCAAVGYFRGGSTLVTLAEHWNGTEWVVQSTPTPQGEGNLSGVSCAASKSCTAGGTYYSSLESDHGWRPLIERWEGSSWFIPEITTPSAPAGWWHESYFEAISCPQTKACMAVASSLSAPNGGLSSYHAISEHEVARLLGSFTFSPKTPHAGEPIGFDGTASTDPAHAIERYEWDFGDGSHETGATPSHNYAQPGDYTVTLIITDDEGVTAEISHLVTVAAESSLIASFSFAPPAPLAGESISFDASASSDPDGSIESYGWDFGDGSHGSGETPSHTYTHAGSYTVTLTVTDNEGKSGEVSHVVSVADTPPTASFAVTTPSPTGGQPVAFDASASSDPDGSIESYGWDFGDGSHGSGETPSHTYTHAGSYTVTLTVGDNDGLSAVVQRQIPIAWASSAFAIHRTATRCNGAIDLALRAPGPGVFKARATITAVARARASRSNRETRNLHNACLVRLRTISFVQRRPSRSSRRRHGSAPHSQRRHRLRYGSGITRTHAAGTARLTIRPRRVALRAMRSHPHCRWRVQVAISFSPSGESQEQSAYLYLWFFGTIAAVTGRSPNQASHA